MTTQSNNATPPLTALHSFHPGWFGAVMGTAIVGVATFMNPGNIVALAPLAHIVGIAFAILAYALAIAIGVPYVWRWFRHRDAAWKDLQHPILGGLYGTFPGGIIVLAVTAHGTRRMVGLRSDRVIEVTTLDAPELEPRPTVRGHWSGDSIAGIGRRNGQFVTVLDLDHLLGDLELPAEDARAA